MAKLVYIFFTLYFLFQLWLYRKENWKIKAVIILLVGLFGIAAVFGGEILIFAVVLSIMGYLGYAFYYYWVGFDWTKRLITIFLIAAAILLLYMLQHFH